MKRCVCPISKTCWEENIFWRHNFTFLQNGCLITFKKMQKQPPEKFYKKAILKSFTIFTGKHLCLNLFLMQNFAKCFRVPILTYRKSCTQDPRPQYDQVELGTRDPLSGTLINNLLAWKFECSNESIDILLES